LIRRPLLAEAPEGLDDILVQVTEIETPAERHAQGRGIPLRRLLERLVLSQLLLEELIGQIPALHGEGLGQRQFHRRLLPSKDALLPRGLSQARSQKGCRSPLAEDFIPAREPLLTGPLQGSPKGLIQIAGDVLALGLEGGTHLLPKGG